MSTPMNEAPAATGIEGAASPAPLLSFFLAHHFLIWQFAKKDVLARYRGSVLGLLWSILNPLGMLAAYTLVFGFILKSRSGFGASGNLDFALLLYAGLVAHGLVSDCITRSPMLIAAQPNLVKKVVFPLELLPVSSLAANLFQSAINLAILLVFHALLAPEWSWHALLSPVALLCLVPFLLGAVWMLSAFGVFVRDIAQVMALASSLLLFLSPVFYPVTLVPEPWRAALYLNPLTPAIENLRRMLFAHEMPHWGELALLFAAGCVFAWIGLVLFRRMRPGFADVV
ncbi:MAG: ABC transporter permease [Betaproteobacteria bacterium]|nr:ABC transporter permease [Betaproteobacteria bacterium]